MIEEFCELNSMLLSDDMRTAELQRKKLSLVTSIQQQEERVRSPAIYAAVTTAVDIISVQLTLIIHKYYILSILMLTV